MDLPFSSLLSPLPGSHTALAAAQARTRGYPGEPVEFLVFNRECTYRFMPQILGLLRFNKLTTFEEYQ